MSREFKNLSKKELERLANLGNPSAIAEMATRKRNNMLAWLLIGGIVVGLFLFIRKFPKASAVIFGILLIGGVVGYYVYKDEIHGRSVQQAAVQNTKPQIQQAVQTGRQQIQQSYQQQQQQTYQQQQTQQEARQAYFNAPYLSDAEYKNMRMRSEAFRRADDALNTIWKDIVNHPDFVGTQVRDFREDQRQWVRSGRDQDAHEFMAAGYDRVSAYTKATVKRAKELYAVLQYFNGVDNNADGNASSNAGALNNARVVIDGTGVRMRFGSSLNTDWLKWENGATRAPNKGERLRYVGSEGDWYIVEYVGRRFYVSKEYSHLEY